MKPPDPPSSDLIEPLSERGQAIFDGALQLPMQQRPAYVEQACANDAALCQQVKKMLDAHEKAGGFLESFAGAKEANTVLACPVTEKPGDKIGRYKLLQQLGEGGCGVVYMAEQEEPVRRRVAVKVIKLGMDTKSVIARFEAERQALAMMDHPNIARVLDAGATETGRPFFVMELVRGIKITEYCDQNKLSTDDRLKLLIQVCFAIQHAHQKGIIHRDIKPSNILITLHDGVPVPKVIDFGIAKATQGRLTDQTLFTAFEQFIGTPAYMSPEQAEMSGLDIDTRCDIYALGVLLYELLTGQTPFDAKALIASGLDQMRHTIRELEPDRPSIRLSTLLNADLTTTAAHRRTDAPKLIHTLRGDLDWIVMKALEKDRTRRYDTASNLAQDVQRHLNNEPVVASPPSRIYRLQKLIRRNKSVFVASGAVALALIIGLISSLYLLARANEAYRRAVAAEQTQARMRQEAEKAARIGQGLSQAGLLLTREQYEEAEKLVDGLPPYPASISILNVLGMIHARRGQWSEAVRCFTRSTEINPTDHDAYHCLAPLLARSGDVEGYRNLCVRILRHFANTTDATIAERMAKDCLIQADPRADFASVNRMVNTAVAAGPEHPYWSYFQFVKGLAEYRLGHFSTAAEWVSKVISDTHDPNRTLAAHMVLAMAQYQLKQTEQSRVTLEKGIELANADVRNTQGPQWNDQLSSRLLLEEAKALIEKSSREETK